MNFAIKASEEQVYLLFRAVAKSRHYVVLPQKCGVCDAYLESERWKGAKAAERGRKEKGPKGGKGAEKGLKGQKGES